MKSIILSFTVILFFVESAVSQDKKYEYNFSSVEFLKEPDVNDKSEEVYPLYNRAYDTMYFVRSHHFGNTGSNKDNFDIWFSAKNAGGVWSPSKGISELNNSHNNSIVGLGQATNHLYLINSYTSSVIRDQGISFTKLKNGKWMKPEPLEFYVDTHHKVYSFFINHTEDIILITMYNNLSEGHEDLFVSLKSEDGRWRDPIYLGHDINSEGFETSPFLADDRKTLFFTSNGFGGLGDGDVFMTTRLDDTWVNWTKPKNLGKAVNSDKFDGYFSLYENGTFLLSSNRDSEFTDVFTGKWDLVEVEEEKKSEMVVEVKEEAKALLKESLPDNFKIQFDFNSSKFDRKKYKDNLEEAVDFLKVNPNVGLVIEGNTDKKGDELYNLILSHKRATEVADYLKVKLPKGSEDKVFVQPNGEVKASNDDNTSRTVVIKYILLNK